MFPSTATGECHKQPVWQDPKAPCSLTCSIKVTLEPKKKKPHRSRNLTHHLHYIYLEILGLYVREKCENVLWESSEGRNQSEPGQKS